MSMLHPVSSTKIRRATIRRNPSTISQCQPRLVSSRSIATSTFFFPRELQAAQRATHGGWVNRLTLWPSDLFAEFLERRVRLFLNGLAQQSEFFSLQKRLLTASMRQRLHMSQGLPLDQKFLQPVKTYLEEFRNRTLGQLFFVHSRDH